ncbi:hypothetical protein HK405_004228 [Cladochytrium tenue]|nr:hypothetical protein HK405_004228 [Cladochytrium tenue]
MLDGIRRCRRGSITSLWHPGRIGENPRASIKRDTPTLLSSAPRQPENLLFSIAPPPSPPAPPSSLPRRHRSYPFCPFHTMVHHNCALAALGLATLAALAPVAGVAAHGHMTDPPSRFATGMANSDHQRDPINLRTADFGSSWTTPMTPCGGVLKSQSNVATTSVTAGQTYTVAWEIGFWTGAALHQGSITVSIAAASSDDSGTFTQLGTVSLVGDSTVDTTPHSMDVTIPSTYTSGTALTMQWYWHGSLTDEDYYNCADLVVSGSSGSGSGSSATTSSAAGIAGTTTTTSSTAVGVTTLTTKATSTTTSSTLTGAQGAGTTATTATAASTTSTTSTSTSAAASASSSSTTSSCTPSAMTCDYASDTVQVCNGSGAWVSLGSLGACTAGSYVCLGDHFAQCTAAGDWTCMACAPGTTCTPNGDSITCSASVRRRRRGALY